MEKAKKAPWFCIEVEHPDTGEKYFYPDDYSQEHFESALRYKARPNDLFICSYPKCGSTWLQNIVWLIVHHGEPIPSTKKLQECVPMLEFDGCEFTESTIDGKHPHIIKTHLPYSFVPQHPKAKYLNIARNPKDAVVSNYHFMIAYDHKRFKDLDLNEYFDLYAKGEVEFGGYFDHVIEWYAKRDQPNVLFLLYEDLKTNTRSEILKIARFLGDEYEALLLKNNEEILCKVLDQSSFKSMQKDKSKWVPENVEVPSNMNVVRKGKIGDWRNHLSSEQSATMDQLLKDRGESSGVDLLWKNYSEV